MTQRSILLKKSLLIISIFVQLDHLNDKNRHNFFSSIFFEPEVQKRNLREKHSKSSDKRTR